METRTVFVGIVDERTVFVRNIPGHLSKSDVWTVMCREQMVNPHDVESLHITYREGQDIFLSNKKWLGLVCSRTIVIV